MTSLFRLSGNLPFNSKNTHTILCRTIEGDYSFNDKIWKSVTENAKDLIRRLL